MKYFFTTLLLFLSFISKAQWSNTTNEFYDSLAMPVSTADGDQRFPLVQRSYPDSGYFVIWEDNRDGINYSHTQIFVQKFDKNGNKLWTNDGVPVATSTYALHYNIFTAKHSPGTTFSGSNDVDLRDFSFTATDSANGFYISYVKDSNFNFGVNHSYIVMVQHIQENGTPVFPGEGFRVFTGAGPGSPQLIPDGNKGFFVGYTSGLSPYVLCYKDESGVMKLYGGGPVAVNTIQDSVYENMSCLRYLPAGDPSVHCDGDFIIYPNKQEGCEVAIIMTKDYVNNSTPYGYHFLAYNELFRVKKNSIVSEPGIGTPYTNYNMDSVVVLWQARTRKGLPRSCGSSFFEDVFVINNGFQQISGYHDEMYFAKGTVVPTDGNININVMGVTERNSGQLYVSKVYTRANEKYDSVPYSVTVVYKNFIFELPSPGQDILNKGIDTIFLNPFTDAHPFNFSLSSSKNIINASASLERASDQHDILLQQLKVERQTSSSFAVVLNTNNKNGIKIAGDNITGNSNTQLGYNPPYISVDDAGHAFFYIVEAGADYLLRASPIGDGSHLLWGSVGKPVRNIYTDLSLPFVAMSPNDGTGVIAWTGSYNGSSTHGMDIFIRHLDNLNVGNYIPPIGKVKLLINPAGFGGLKSLSPNYISGLSGKWNTLNYRDNIPVVGLSDDNNLGVVAVSLYQNWKVGIRKYKNQPYLDRNYTIVPQNNPTILQRVRLYFTNDEMNALKAADPTITGPEMLQVVKQPSASPDAPGSFTPSASDEIINPTSWGAVDGGYYLEINVKSFSNFFIQKINGPLPVTWLNINAQWKDKFNAIVSWQLGVQSNVKMYHLQHSVDGVQFTDVCEVAPDNSHLYACTVPADQDKIHYYRVRQTGMDGEVSFSKTVVLNAIGADAIMLYPNPAGNILHINGLDKFNEIVIYGLQGNILQRLKIAQPAVQIDVSALASGTYILEIISSGKENKRYKFIRQ